MGGILSLLLDLAEALPDLSAATGFSVEAIISGEAAAAIETEASWLLAQGLVATSAEALEVTGITAESVSMLFAVPSALRDLVGLGVTFQTVTGVSALVAAGIRFEQQQVSIVNHNSMALSLWRPADYYDILFPGVNSFVQAINVVEHWSSSLFNYLGRYIWESLAREARLQIGQATSSLALRAHHSFHDALARVAENTRWVLTTGPANVYSALSDYYAQLPPLNPPQVRQLERRLERRRRAITSDEAPHNSGEVVQKYDAPGGAHQRTTPDWMLPLILGLYGDITPAWGAEIQKIEDKEDGPKKKRRKL
ncbi:VP2 minor capsid protein [Bat polyomavirus 5a]|uniref:Minor capsid protein n=1 Tax=Bat polyomavirus 5a TaxID=1623687 RepID=A0A0D5ZYR0_9POLY|nr:VP2 minor capsid protein [Bat polyomavirus 5a]BAQ55566.1 VP2 minor capsid protein [Bat polyomavirus 5a]